ncbi:SitA6 family polymorphic toxin lipoprotein [Hyalangium gracile]|uniref:SitA6 family polymorphic toxin lipoprotein n=1 Tax=Hyalangium gracile TaxID=394092 RepID=UPI001CC95D74|nr:TIGR02269 family lipoprotein [Hyalangium gracile]
MRLHAFWLLLCTLLSACATGPAPRHDEEPSEESVSSFEEGCERDTSVVLLCSESDCGFFYCRDLDLEPGGLQLTRGGGGFFAPPAAPGGRPHRWWSRSWLRRNANPILTFRLHPSQAPKPPLAQLPPGRYVRHHIFPRASDLASWFRERGVDIHGFSLVIPEHVHHRIHSGGPRGGLWNAAWRQFKDANPHASPPEIYWHAGELIHRFELIGPVVPYYKRRL